MNFAVGRHGGEDGNEKMAKRECIGAVELSSVAIGYRTLDAMMKAAEVELLIARTICSGKYLIVIAGAVSDVTSSVRAGVADAGEAIIDQLILPQVHQSVFPALGQSITVDEANVQAMGVLESFSGVSIIAGADAAAKAAGVTLYRIHVAMALGGKGVCMFAGTLADCQSAAAAGAEQIRQRGLLANQVVIANPAKELFGEYL